MSADEDLREMISAPKLTLEKQIEQVSDDPALLLLCAYVDTYAHTYTDTRTYAHAMTLSLTLTHASQMQEWQRDPKKMNFVITMNNTPMASGAKSGASTPVQENSNTIVGDINLFLEDEELDTGA